eukprot:TRINITY_DN3739_c0_g1_i8.p1 TRINITY_DN3739_c0_g1~~TRINITY_DN3739_c0_g1_i8.p1  ORF type:complete len:287 (-),score=63.81 TRINITY_DN3739_c0_g1_i8:13-873(-)
MIRYFNEEVELGHMVQFRSEFDTAGSRSVYFLEIEMLFVEIAAVGGTDFAVSLFAVNGESAVNLKSICKRRYKLEKVTSDIFSGYIPVIFDEIHYSVLNLAVHSSIMDFKLRQSSLESCSPKDEDTEPVIKFVQTKPAKESTTSKSTRKITFAEYLFGETSGKLPKRVEAEYTDEVYEEYVGCLLRIKMKLASKLEDLGQKTAAKSHTKSSKNNGKVEKESLVNAGNKKTAFSIYCKSLDPYTVSGKLIEEINFVSGDIMEMWLSLIHICRCRRYAVCRSRWSPYH